MAMEKFRSSPLVVPPPEYNQQYMTQLIRILGLYFSQLDSQTPLQNDSYRGLRFIGGDFTGDNVTATTVNAVNFAGGDYTGDNANITTGVFNTVYGDGFQGGNGVFNQLTGANVNASLFTGAGYQISFPYVAPSDSTNQYADGDDDPTIVTWDALDEVRGFTLNNDETITADYEGVYKFDYSLQLANTDNAIHNVTVWIEINGSKVAKSATKFSVPARKSAGNPAFICAYSTVMFQCNAGDDIALWWATTKAYSTTGPTDGVYMLYEAVQVAPYAHPAIPSAIGTITYVSAPVPAKTQVVPIGVQGEGKIGEITVITP